MKNRLFFNKAVLWVIFALSAHFWLAVIGIDQPTILKTLGIWAADLTIGLSWVTAWRSLNTAYHLKQEQSPIVCHHGAINALRKHVDSGEWRYPSHEVTALREGKLEAEIRLGAHGVRKPDKSVPLYDYQSMPGHLNMLKMRPGDRKMLVRIRPGQGICVLEMKLEVHESTRTDLEGLEQLLCEHVKEAERWWVDDITGFSQATGNPAYFQMTVFKRGPL